MYNSRYLTGRKEIYHVERKKLIFLIYDKNAKPRFNELLSENLESKTFLEKDVIRTEKEESSLRSYFNESIFMDGLLRPEGPNIVPKVDIDQDLTTGYKCDCSMFGVRNFDINSVGVYDSTESIQGTFLLYEDKDYDYYWDNEKKKQTACKSVMPFTMLDNGSFESEVTIQDRETVVVSTSVNVIRNVVGCNFDGESIRDGMFSGLPHEDGRGSFEFNEYYKIISNRTRLLHYSESSDFFEVYDLPEGWVIEDGISKLEYPKVFDDVVFDKRDKDLKEINSILATRTNSKGIPLVKRMNNSK